MKTFSVQVLAEADSDVDQLFLFLHALRLRTATKGSLRIVVARTPFEPALAEVRLPWLMVSVSEELPFVGPIFCDRGLFCWECLVRRWWGNGHSLETSGRVLRAPENLYRVAAREAARWLNGRPTELARGFLEVHSSSTYHPVIPVCPKCAGRSPRVRLSAAMLRSPATGLVSFAECQELRSGVHRAVATLSQRRITDYSGQIHEISPQLVDGKGPDGAAAMRSCLGEAAERYSLVHQGIEPRLVASFAELGSRAIDPRSILLWSDRQYLRRTGWNRRQPSFHYVGEPFDPRAKMDWVQVSDAASGKPSLVPAECVFLGYGTRYGKADSSGCAAGKTRSHAIRAAILELVERDALAIWWYNRVRRPRIAGVLGNDALARALSQKGRRFWLLDLTTDLGIPVVAGVSPDAQGSHIVLGAGASPDPREAVRKALQEMVAHLTDLDGQKMPGTVDSNHRAFWDWWRTGRLDDNPHLVPDAGKPVVLQALDGSIRRRLTRAGLKVYLYDHTRPELKIPVIRAIVPGLRPVWARFAPGRLFDVPVQMGWLDRPRRETELNPIPFFQ